MWIYHIFVCLFTGDGPWGCFWFGAICIASCSVGKRICLQCRRPGFNPQVGKIPWRRAWQSTPVFLPGESHGQRSLEASSPWGHTESDTSEATEHAHTHRVKNTLPSLLFEAPQNASLAALSSPTAHFPQYPLWTPLPHCLLRLLPALASA